MTVTKEQWAQMKEEERYGMIASILLRLDKVEADLELVMTLSRLDEVDKTLDKISKRLEEMTGSGI